MEPSTVRVHVARSAAGRARIRRRSRRARLAGIAGLILCLGMSACGGAASTAERPVLRLGYLPNITHAAALVGIDSGVFARALRPHASLVPHAFYAGPDIVQALFSGTLDAAYIGPNPAINAFVRSGGRAVRSVAGATSGGASLVVRPGIRRAADLDGTTLASPQLGNTQDVALRTWLRRRGLVADALGGGDVSIVPQDNAQAFEAMRSGTIGGAWVPEPWAARMVLEAGAKVLVDERDLWPGGRHATTQLVVRTEFLRDRPDAVEALLRGHVETTRFLDDRPRTARHRVNRALARISAPLPRDVLELAWGNLVFTSDPLADTVRAAARHARALGFLPSDDVTGMWDLSLLNRVLLSVGQPEVPAA